MNQLLNDYGLFVLVLLFIVLSLYQEFCKYRNIFNTFCWIKKYDVR